MSMDNKKFFQLTISVPVVHYGTCIAMIEAESVEDAKAKFDEILASEEQVDFVTQHGVIYKDHAVREDLVELVSVQEFSVSTEGKLRDYEVPILTEINVLAQAHILVEARSPEEAQLKVSQMTDLDFSEEDLEDLERNHNFRGRVDFVLTPTIGWNGEHEDEE